MSGRAVVLSPRDWRLASDWHDRGVPLGLVLEVLEHRTARPPRGLGGIATAVEEAWNAVRGGRAARPRGDASAPSDGAARPDPAAAWEDARAAAPLGGELRALLDRLHDASRAGSCDAEIDARLDDALAEVVPDELREAVEREARSSLATHRDRMPPAAYASTLRRAIVGRLRERLGLPRRRP